MDEKVNDAPSLRQPVEVGFQSERTYGALPEDMGLLDLSPVEMMFWMYCPVRTPGSHFVIPPNLERFKPILLAAFNSEASGDSDRYVYLTAKTLWVGGDNIGNRPGWHSDGFGTDDINYIWYDRAPTEFIEDSFTLPGDCEDAMVAMTVRAAARPLVTYPDKHLLRLTPSCIHRSPVRFAEGMRTFVKVSISTERYNLEGNSINHGLIEHWPLVPREAVRNHPVRADYISDGITKASSGIKNQ